jgi:MFS family permease
MNPKNYSAQFWLLCLSSYFFFGSFNMVIPELPKFLSSLGGGEYKGLIISLFTLTAMISRPFSGKLADTVGRIPVMVFGSVVCLICSLIYPTITSIYTFFLLRFFHGFSTGFTPTGTTAYVADVIPGDRRGEAMGLLGTFGTVGMASAPAIGGWVAAEFSLNTMFYCSSLFGLLAILSFAGVRETLPSTEKFRHHHLKISKADLYEPAVIIPFVVMLLSYYSYGVMLTLIPDLSEELGLINKGIVFTVFTLASVAVRIVAGRVSDRYGRKNVLIVSTALISISLVFMGLSTEKWILWTGGILYGVANGMTSPTLFAWTTDLSNDQNRGRAFAFIYIAMELGIGLGAIISGFTYGNNPENFLLAFGTGSVLSVLALLYLIFKRSPHG